MKALVTGGAGFIGSNLCAELRRLGAQVNVVDDLSSGYESNLASIEGVNLFRGDIRDRELVDAACEGCDTVFHLAASVGNKRSIDFPLVDTAINVNGTMNVLEAARKAGVKKIVASSSAGIFGDGQQTRDFVNVADVVQANIKAAQARGVVGAFNIASDTQVKIQDLAESVLSYIDEPVKIEYLPKRAGDVLHSRADISAARAAFGYEPSVALETGLASYMAWAKQEAATRKNAGK